MTVALVHDPAPIADIAGCGSEIMESFLSRATVQDPLRTLRRIEDAGPHELAHVHYAAAITSAIRASLRQFGDSEIETVGDGVYRLAVTVAGRRHFVTVAPEPMNAEGRNA